MQTIIEQILENQTMSVVVRLHNDFAKTYDEWRIFEIKNSNSKFECLGSDSKKQKFDDESSIIKLTPLDHNDYSKIKPGCTIYPLYTMDKPKVGYVIKSRNYGYTIEDLSKSEPIYDTLKEKEFAAGVDLSMYIGTIHALFINKDKHIDIYIPNKKVYDWIKNNELPPIENIRNKEEYKPLVSRVVKCRQQILDNKNKTLDVKFWYTIIWGSI